MILEIIAILFLIQITNLVSRLIGRRHDVLHFVSRSDPHGARRGAGIGPTRQVASPEPQTQRLAHAQI